MAKLIRLAALCVLCVIIRGEEEFASSQLRNELLKKVNSERNWAATVYPFSDSFCVTKKKSCPANSPAVKSWKGNDFVVKGWRFCAHPTTCSGMSISVEEPHSPTSYPSVYCRDTSGFSTRTLCFPATITPCENKPCRKSLANFCNYYIRREPPAGFTRWLKAVGIDPSKNRQCLQAKYITP